MTKWADLAGVFSPDSAITDIEKLYGRQIQITEVLKKFASSESVPVVSGPPGVGKTSLLNVAGSFLSRPEIAPEDLSFYLPSEATERLVLWVQSRPEMASANDLAEAVLKWLEYVIEALPRRSRFKANEFKVEAKAPFGTLSSVWKRIDEPSLEPVERLAALATLQAEDHDRELVIIVDECEHLPWLDDLLGLVRQFDEFGVRFLLGVRDHAVPKLRSGRHSTYRPPVEVALPRFGESDVDQFFAGRCEMLRAMGVTWLLDDFAIDGIYDMSGGEPWYLQMIGAQMLEDKSGDIETQLAESGVAAVRSSVEEFKRSEQKVITTRLASVTADAYESIVRGAPMREEVLQALAGFPGTLIPEGFAAYIGRRRKYRSAKAVDKFLTWSPEPVLLRSASAPNCLEFSSHQFRVYCRLGPTLNESSREIARTLIQSWDADQER